ncbi:MAG: hypothetical protein CAF45_015745 [Nitrospira sp. CG24E]|nr:MAG: hypothetical protein CAF45_015745 [Nitrospira sp. CG24E]
MIPFTTLCPIDALHEPFEFLVSSLWFLISSFRFMYESSCHLPLPTCYSPLPTSYSPLTTPHLLLPTYYSPLTTLHLLLATHYSPLAMRQTRTPGLQDCGFSQPSALRGHFRSWVPRLTRIAESPVPARSDEATDEWDRAGGLACTSPVNPRKALSPNRTSARPATFGERGELRCCFMMSLLFEECEDRERFEFLVSSCELQILNSRCMCKSSGHSLLTTHHFQLTTHHFPRATRYLEFETPERASCHEHPYSPSFP